MDIDQRLRQVEGILDYRFKRSPLLSEALTAPGAEDNQSDGNRRLSQLGLDVINLFLNLDGYTRKCERSEISVRKQRLSSLGHRAFVGKRMAIDRCIKYNPRAGVGCASVIAKSLSAIIAAVYLDSGSHDRTWDILQHIGFFIQKDDGVDPNMLGSDALADLHFPPISSTMLVPEICNAKDATSSAKCPAVESQRICMDSEPDSSRISVTDERLNLAHQTVTDVEKTTTTKQIPLRQIKNPRKRKVQQLVDDSDIDIFLGQETLKCKAHGLPAPEESYYNLAIQEWSFAIMDDRVRKTAQRLLLGIASPQAITNLQAAVQSWHARADAQSLRLPEPDSKSETFLFIEKINQEIGGLLLLRRFYILRLFEMCGGCDTPSCSGFVQENPEGSMATEKRKGNLRNKAEFEVAEHMMKEVFPHFHRGTRDYEEKLRAAKCFRKIGRRLHAISRRFGKGVLAVIPFHESPGQPNLEVTDNMLERLPEKVLSELIDMLDTNQGDILRKFSAAALKIVESMLNRSLYSCDTFILEYSSTAHISRLPKTSSGLLALLRDADKNMQASVCRSATG